jgi:hypothetical protein
MINKRKAMSRPKAHFRQDLDEEEQEILQSYKRGEWTSVKNFAKEKKQARKVATNTIYQK